MPTPPQSFEVTGWQSTGGTTLGLRFGAENARTFVDASRPAVTIELDGTSHEFPIRASFWKKCPEFRGAPITAWMLRHRLAPWPRGAPPRVRMSHIGCNTFRAHVPPSHAALHQPHEQ